MRITLRDYRAVERADIEIDGLLTLIAGDLGVGKSSVLTSIGAILSGEAVAWPDVLKKDLGDLIRTGAENATIAATDGPEDTGWQRAVEYPSGRMTSFGVGAPTISPSSAGRASLLDLALKERAEFLAEYLNPQPTEEEFEKAASDILLNKKTTKIVWEKICEDGWDSTFASAKKATPKAKGRWLEITGEEWGKVKSPNWRPPHWDDALLESTEEQLVQELEAAGEKVARAVASAAVDAVQLDGMRERAADLPDLEEALEAKREEVSAAQDKADAAVEAAEKMPALVGKGNARSDCPHCGQRIEIEIIEKRNQGVVYDRNVRLLEPMPDEDVRKKVSARKKADEAVMSAKTDLRKLTAEFEELEAKIETARSASQSLELEKGKDDGKGGASLADAQAALAEARNALAAYQTHARAQKVHRLIATNMRIREDLLDPSALRGTVLARKLKEFCDERLLPLLDATGTNVVTGEVTHGQRWPDVTIDPDFTVRWDGFAYPLVSGSQQWQTRAIIQTALARVRGDRLIIMDEAGSMLTARALNGLLAMLKFAGVPAVIGFKEPKAERLPPLAKMGLGRVYVVENGECREMGGD